MHVLSLGTCLLLHARREALAADEPPLAEVEVTAEPISEAEQRAPTAFISVVDTETRESEFVTAADVLQELVGVQVQRFGGLGAFSTISIRGSSANQVPIYLDGIPLSQSVDQTVNLADLPLDSLERIEVYRGTVPVGFGGGGIGGVVNLVTKPASATPSTELSAGYGSFETRKVVASHTQQLAGWDVLAHLTYLGSKGDFTYKDNNGTPDNPTDDTTTTRINNAFDAVGMLLKATRDLGDRLAFDATEEFFYKDQGVPGPGCCQFPDPSLNAARSLTYFRLRKAGLFDGAVDAAANFYGVYNRQAFDDPQGNFGAVLDTRNQTALVGTSNTGTWFAPFNQGVSWFSELAYEAFFPYNRTNPPLLPQNGPTQTRLRLTASLQDEIALFRDRLLIVPSLRYEHLLDDFSGTNPSDIPNTSTHTNNLDLWTPAIGGVVRVVPWLSLRANIGRFQRAPSFGELFGNSGTLLGNANLKPETGITRDVGFLVNLDAHGWLDRAQLQYAYFHNNFTDLITFEQASRTTFQFFNVGDARVEGHEVSVTAAALRHADLEVNYTHQDSADLTRSDNPFGNQLPLLPADELFVRTQLFNTWGKVFYEYTYISSDPTDPANFTMVPSRSIHTVGGALTPLDWIEVKFEAANITNADVRDLGDFPLPGLSFFGSIKVTL
jgi:iron complex outermembrane receptor protein